MENRLDIYIESLKEVIKKNNLNISDESILSHSINQMNNDKSLEEIQRQEKNFYWEKPNKDKNLATDKQINLLTSLKLKFPEDITKFEAKKLIESKLGKKNAK